MKLKTLTLSAATAALLATGGAFAQDTKTQPDVPPVVTPDQPAANKPMPGPAAEKPMPSTAAEKPSAAKGADAGAKAATGSVQFTSSAGANDLITSQLVGTAVRNSKDENLGDINDVILSKEGKPTVAVIGVGGFLGIGEKNVGIPFESLQFTKDNNKNIARLDMDKKALEAAPTFVYPEKPAAAPAKMPASKTN